MEVVCRHTGPYLSTLGIHPHGDLGLTSGLAKFAACASYGAPVELGLPVSAGYLDSHQLVDALGFIPRGRFHRPQQAERFGEQLRNAGIV